MAPTLELSLLAPAVRKPTGPSLLTRVVPWTVRLVGTAVVLVVTSVGVVTHVVPTR